MYRQDTPYTCTPAHRYTVLRYTGTYIKSLSLQLPDHKCSGTHKPRVQESCNTVSCPMWETDKWSEVRVHAILRE